MAGNSPEISPEVLTFVNERGIRAAVGVAVEADSNKDYEKAIAYYRAACRSSAAKRGRDDIITIDIKQDLSQLYFKVGQASKGRDLVTQLLISAEREYTRSLRTKGDEDKQFRERLWSIITVELSRWYERARVAHHKKHLSDATADFLFLQRRLSLLWMDIGEPTDCPEIPDWIKEIQSDVDRAVRRCEMDALITKIQTQIETFFTPANLTKDTYLRQHMNEEGYVLLLRIASFKSVYTISQNMAIIRLACEESEILGLQRGNEGVDRVRTKDDPRKWTLPWKERHRDIPDRKLKEFVLLVENKQKTCIEFQVWEAAARLAHKQKLSGMKPGPESEGQWSNGSGGKARTKSSERLEKPSFSSLAPPKDSMKDSRRKSTGDLKAKDAAVAASGGPQAKLFDTTEGEASAHEDQAWFTKYLDLYTMPLLDDQRREQNFHKANCKFWLPAGCKCEMPKNRRRVRIAILDTGIDMKNESLRKNKRIRETWSASPEEFSNDEDTAGHGTHLASLLLRVAPAADIYVARVCKDGSNFTEDNIAAAIDKAASADWDVDIITMSFGFPQRKDKITTAIRGAFNKGILLFAAASNGGLNSNIQIAYPARDERVLAIFSTDSMGDPTPCTFNPPPIKNRPNFCTLGKDVRSAGRTMSGTSVATPIAAATAALILEFLRQKPLAGQVETIKRAHLLEEETVGVMKKILQDMSISKVGYNYIPPWRLLIRDLDDDPQYQPTLAQARDTVVRKISESLKEY